MVTRHHLDVVEAHFAAQMSKDFSAIFELDPELSIRESFENGSVSLGQLVTSHNFNRAKLILAEAELGLQVAEYRIYIDGEENCVYDEVSSNEEVKKVR